MIEVSAFRWVPPFAQGLVRELRVRWALEEAGEPYQVRLIGPDDQKSSSYRELQPFGQVPAIVEDDLVLFESGAIVLHIAERSRALWPVDPAARERVRTWVFAALNTVEPPVMMRVVMDLQKPEEAAPPSLVAKVTSLIEARLASLAAALGNRDYLVDRFSAADLLMASVLRILRTTDLVAAHPKLVAYQTRCEARPAFQKALADHMANFAEHAPPAS